jgi:hypothetical protein
MAWPQKAQKIQALAVLKRHRTGAIFKPVKSGLDKAVTSHRTPKTTVLLKML